MTTPTPTILFANKVCGHRTAPVIGYTQAGLPVCQLGKWKFAFNGKYRLLEEGETIPEDVPIPEYTPVAELRLTMKAKPLSERPQRKANDNTEEKPLRPCSCGCSGVTSSLFQPGHDARALGMLKKLHRGDITEIPEILTKLITNNAKWREKWEAVKRNEKVH